MRFKRAIIFVLCAILSLSFVACGNIDVTDPNTPPVDSNVKYTVLFKVGDAAAAGVTVSEQGREVASGAALGALPTLNGQDDYEGYAFDGWYDANNKKYEASTSITADVTLTAKWVQAVMYTLTFSVGTDAAAAGVTVTPTSKKVQQYKSFGELPTPTEYAGYTFMGWYNGTTEYTSTSTALSDLTLEAHWADTAALAAYEGSIKDWAKPGHLYVHYKRYDHDASEEQTPPTAGQTDETHLYNTAIDSEVYGDWGLWAWPKKNANGRLFNAAWIDSSGAVYDILLDQEYTDAGWDGKNKVSQNVKMTYKGETHVGLQLHSIETRTAKDSEFWANDGGDNYVVIEEIKRTDGDCHWFVTEGNVTNGQKAYTVTGKLENPYAGDPNRTKNGTRTNGKDIITDSASDNSGTYPVKSIDNFDSVNGYQIFIASFKDSDGDGIGDLQGIIDELPYLKKLNVDLLWLTPFQTSTNYHGYDINDYKSVDPRWGTMDDYKALVTKAHAAGMKIVMDFVLNHTSQANPWFVKSQKLTKENDVTFFDKTYDEVDYRQFYSWITEAQYNRLSEKEKTHWYKDNYNYYFYSSFSASQPELNYDYKPVRDAILDVCDFWMGNNDYGIALDGFRLDAVKHIYTCNEVKGKTGQTYSSRDEFQAKTGSGNNLKADYSYVSDDDVRFNYDVKRNLNFYREFNNRLKTKYPKAYVVGENLDGWDQRTAKFYEGIDSQFDFALYYNVPRGILKAAGVSGDFGDDFAAVYNRYYRGYSAYSQFNSKYIGGQFTSNHDLPRARDRVNVTSVSENGDKFGSFYTNGSIDGEKHIYDTNDTLHNNITTTGTVLTNKVDDSTTLLKLYYAALMTFPGVTWLYYGDELGMSGLMQHTLTCKQANLATSSTASLPHEDVIYRQPMKWNKATADKFDEENNTSHGNSAFKIGYGNTICELVGLNTTDYIPSVAESTDNSGNFKSGTLLEWTAKLTKLRKDMGVTNKATVTKNSSYEYTVRGTNGSFKVKFATSAASGTPINGLSFTGSANGKTLSVIITNA